MQPRESFSTTSIPSTHSLSASALSQFNPNTVTESMAYQEQTTLSDALQAAIEQSRSQHSSGALLMVHITNLAMIINGYGHDVAEQVVQDILSRIQAILSKNDYIERTARDQFAIITLNTNAEECERLGIRISNIMQNYGRDKYATAALHVLGIISSALFPDEGSNAPDTLDKAYTALHATTDQTYRPYRIAQEEADQCRQQMGLASYLHSAFRENRLRLAWQPILDAKAHKIAHHEALLRIRSNNGKISSAGPLIPVAEKMGLIEDIDALVMEMVVAELRRSKNASFAFNVSNVTTESHLWLDKLTKLVAETPEIGPRMMVEITETAVQRDLRKVAYFVAAIQSLGAQVALDDFGSGYTSFRQLKALSVDIVKIDGVFIKDIATNSDSRFFVKTLMDFANGFGLKTVAEFVENGEIAKILLDMGIDFLQGYYLGKPENTRSWLADGEYKA
jgi:diguanylate cyclase (GGDEF)-like protein